WLKMLEVKVNPSSYNSLIYITKSTENKSISLTFNITTNQTIKMYSSEKPKRVLKNSVEILSEQDSLESLVANYGWFYNSSTKILYIKFN
ncbi:MAG: hypothetical protein QW321_02280, partial [Candidatus Aenigmatarchaeota archaeon]